jgi:hypothetical protein
MNRNDKRLIETLVWFVNAKILSTRQVEERFRRATRSPIFQVIPPEHVAAYRHDQLKARDWLAQAVGFDRKTPEEQQVFARLVSGNVTDKINAMLVAGYAGGRFQVEWITLLSGVEATLAYACALLLGDASLRRRIGLCAYEKCSKFFLDRRVRGGKAKAYCTQAHSDVDRVNRWRRMQAARKGK